METLYNTSLATGKTKMWSVRTEENKVFMSHGFLDGKMIEHEEICEGKNIGKKNETTPTQQALAVAKSMWEKKVKSGYSVKMSQKAETYFPMLANEMTDKLIKYPCYVQPKLDGIRCLIYMKNGELCFQSRNHSLLQPFPHLVEEINAIFSKSTEPLILDGELYTHDLTFQQITSIVRKKDHPDLFKVQYHLYDLYLPDKTYKERYEMINHLTGWCPMNSLPKLTNVIRVTTSVAQNREQIEQCHNEFVKDGYEGLMVRMPKGLYRQQIRSKELLKYKIFKDDEFMVIGVHEGNGGTAVFECVTKEGRTFGVNMKCTKEDKQDYLIHYENYKGKMLTVKYQELTDDGVPRFPVGIAFRLDM